MSSVEEILSPEGFAPEKSQVDPKEIFWYLNDNGQVKIGRVNFIEFLQLHGFYKVLHLGVFQLARIEHNIVTVTDRVKIKDFVLEHVKAYGESLPLHNDIAPARLLESLIKGGNIYFSEDNLFSLKTILFNPLRSTRDAAYFPYRNGILEVTKHSKSLIEYKTCTFHVWSTQVIDRDFTVMKADEFTDFNFYRFLGKIAADDEKRLASVLSYLGFMLHPFRDPARPQLLVCYDEQISENPEGGTGKGILSQALSHLKPSVFLDGKNFKFDNQFAWQRVTMDTQIVVFQDTTKWFKFDRLHSVLTDGIPVNPKGKKEFFIPYGDSPKFLINTNFILDAEGETNRRRMKSVEFAQHYNSTLTPQDEFGELFFHDWDSDSWARFDNLMAWCVHIYLKKGFMDAESINKEKRLFLQKYGEEALDLLESLEGGRQYTKLEIFEKYKNIVGEEGKKRGSSRWFNGAVRAVHKASEVITGFKEFKVQGKRYVMFQKGDVEQPPGQEENGETHPDELF